MGPAGFAPARAPISLMKQTDSVLVALVVGNNGEVANFFLDLHQQPVVWKGPNGMGPAGFAPPGTPITLMKQTDRVLVALVVGNNGEVANFFLDLDQQPVVWKGPNGMGPARFAPSGAPIALIEQT